MTEDVEGEEVEQIEPVEMQGVHIPHPIADFVVNRRIRDKFGNIGKIICFGCKLAEDTGPIYLAVIQQLLKAGDARRVSCTSDSEHTDR